MAELSMREMLEAGVHFGHRRRRWNPKMRHYIFTERNGIHIIDLQQTIVALEKTFNLVRDTVAEGGALLFVGTKRQAQEAIGEQESGNEPIITPDVENTKVAPELASDFKSSKYEENAP